MKILNTALFMLCLATSSVVAETNEISLALCFPYTKMLSNEWYTYSITLRNDSSTAIPILHDPQSMLNCQLIFDLGTKRKYHKGYFYFDEGWDKINAFEKSRRRTVPLPPGESYTWEFPYGYSQLHQAHELFDITNISVRCLLETNQCVRSNVVPLTFYQEKERCPTVGSLRKVKLGDKRYIFNVFNQRICEILEDDDPDIHHDIDHDTTSISFPRSKRKIFYDTKAAKIIQEGVVK